jgi:hypothetical protein
MTSSLRFLIAAAALAAGGAQAQQQQIVQTQIGVSPVLQVQQLAPQLVQFAGSDVNFQNLVNGLALGLPITLTTPLATGVTQVVSFTPSGSLTPQQIAQTLESARQAAIANGIAAPSAQQIGVLLNGGALPTALGSTAVNGLIAGNTAVTTTLATQPPPAAVLQSGRSFAVSDSPFPRGVSDTPTTTPTTRLTPTPTTSATPAARVIPGTAGAATGATATPATPTPRFGIAR